MFLGLLETRVDLFWQLVAGLGPGSGGRTADFAGGVPESSLKDIALQWSS